MRKEIAVFKGLRLQVLRVSQGGKNTIMSKISC